jgi:dihydroxyacetone kinase
LGANEIEIGMGIHGEKGKYVCDWMECSQLVAKILESLNEHEAIKAGMSTAGTEWVAMINNLGCVTNLEMTLIVNEFVT